MHFRKHIFVLYSETRCRILNVGLQRHTPTYRDYGIFQRSHRGELDPTTLNIRATAWSSQSSPFKKGGLTFSSPRFLHGGLSLADQRVRFLTPSIHIELRQNQASFSVFLCALQQSCDGRSRPGKGAISEAKLACGVEGQVSVVGVHWLPSISYTESWTECGDE